MHQLLGEARLDIVEDIGAIVVPVPDRPEFEARKNDSVVGCQLPVHDAHFRFHDELALPCLELARQGMHLVDSPPVDTLDPPVCELPVHNRVRPVLRPDPEPRHTSIRLIRSRARRFSAARGQ